MHMLFLNVYAVERVYGGPEEGGWWYNCGVPLASVPMPAKELPGHDSNCRECNLARDGVEGHAFCKRFPEDYDYQVEELARDLYLRSLPRMEGSRFPDPNSPTWRGLPQEEKDAFENRAADSITEALPIETHLVPADLEAFQAKTVELKAMFADVNHGNIYSVLGGREVQIQTEEGFAAPWPSQNPRYE